MNKVTQALGGCHMRPVSIDKTFATVASKESATCEGAVVASKWNAADAPNGMAASL